MSKKEKLKTLAKNLRKRSTDAEIRLWFYLRNKQLENLKFRRQHPIEKYIVDFINIEKKIIIELDGSQHAFNKRKDNIRDNFLKSKGYRILRFWNNEIFENIDGVLEMIREELLS